MNTQVFLTQVAASLAGSLVTLLVLYLVFKNELQAFRQPVVKEKAPEPPVGYKDERLQLLPLRLQAHERLIIFIERINPANLLLRVHQQGISVADLQSIILNEVRSEYQHNVAQQLYVDNTTWNVVRGLKDDTLAMLNNAVKGLPEGATGADLSRKILQHMSGITDSPYDLTLDLIKRDIQQLF